MSQISGKIRYRPSLTINVDLNHEEIENNYKHILSVEQDKIQRNTVDYYRKYLFHLYGCEKSEKEINQILSKINRIRKTVLSSLKIIDLSIRKIVVNSIRSDNYFYKKSSGDITVKLYRLKYYDKPCILKCYSFFPDFAYYTSMMETRFENEIIFQEYASELNERYNFITPAIYEYGTCFIYSRETSIVNKVKCMFLIMEDIDGILLENIDFTITTCNNIYKLERQLQCELLSHNDFKPRNLMRKSNSTIDKEEYVVLDYGEATLFGSALRG
jgi:hypothetical protein